MSRVRTIPDPGFAGDDGSAAPEVTAALAAYAQDPDRYLRTLAVVQHSRVLVPVVAVLGEVEYDEQGRARDKTSDMAAVLTTAADGSRGMLAFTGSAAMRRWDISARPVPVSLATAARAAVQERAAALVLDLAGPVLLSVEGESLRCLAGGLRLARDDRGWAWIRPG